MLHVSPEYLKRIKGRPPTHPLKKHLKTGGNKRRKRQPNLQHKLHIPMTGGLIYIKRTIKSSEVRGVKHR